MYFLISLNPFLIVIYKSIIMSDAWDYLMRFGPSSAVPFQQVVAQLRPRWGPNFLVCELSTTRSKDFRVTMPLLEQPHDWD